MAARIAASVRKKRSKSRACSPAGMPMPVPAISTNPNTPSRRAATLTRPPGGVHFSALEGRLSITSASRPASQRKRGEVGDELDPALRRHRPGALDRLPGQLAEIQVLDLETEPPGVGAGDHEEVAGEPQQPLGVALDHEVPLVV